MKRRAFLVALGGAAFALPLATHGQQQSTPVIGFLGVASPAGFAAEVASFNAGLQQSGWTLGQNVAVEYRWADGHFDRLPELASELVARHVSVIATSGGALAARSARDATVTIPIVFETGVDPVEAGLVRSFAHPGGNLTGITIATGELNPKRLDLLSELVPDTRVIAMLVNPNNSQTGHLASVAEQAARAKGLALPILKAGSEHEFDPAFAALGGLHAGALLVGNDPFFYEKRVQLVELAARYSMPAMYEWREFTAIGGLASYGTSLTAMYRRFGAYVGRVLSGAKPSDLPIEQPTKFELMINLKTAKRLGLAVPPSLLARVDEVIE
jgi:ABC-type uncharacterized transport system substrate-binding protein